MEPGQPRTAQATPVPGGISRSHWKWGRALHSALVSWRADCQRSPGGWLGGPPRRNSLQGLLPARLVEAGPEHRACLGPQLGRCPQSPFAGGHPAPLLSLPLQTMETQVEEWCKEVGELQAQVAALPLEATSKEMVGEKQSMVGTRIVRLIEPLKERRRILLASKELHQVSHDLEDELVSGRGGRGLQPGKGSSSSSSTPCLGLWRSG